MTNATTSDSQARPALLSIARPSIAIHGASADATSLALELDLALQSHSSSFEHLHAEVREARLDCQRARAALETTRGPVRGGSHYLQRPPAIRERLTTLPLGLASWVG